MQVAMEHPQGVPRSQGVRQLPGKTDCVATRQAALLHILPQRSARQGRCRDNDPFLGRLHVMHGRHTGMIHHSRAHAPQQALASAFILDRESARKDNGYETVQVKTLCVIGRLPPVYAAAAPQFVVRDGATRRIEFGIVALAKHGHIGAFGDRDAATLV
jgi:hypothetical protein